MKDYFLSGFLCLMLSLIAAANDLPDIKEGLWELTFESDIAATPTPMPSVAYTSQRCLNKQTATDPHVLMQNKHCEILDLNQQVDLLTWKMRCPQQGRQMIGDGKVNYSHESFNGSFNMTMQGEGDITTQTTGRYLGNCK